MVDQHRSDVLGARSRPRWSDVTPFILLQRAVGALTPAGQGRWTRREPTRRRLALPAAGAADALPGTMRESQEVVPPAPARPAGANVR